MQCSRHATVRSRGFEGAPGSLMIGGGRRGRRLRRRKTSLANAAITIHGFGVKKNNYAERDGLEGNLALR